MYEVKSLQQLHINVKNLRVFVLLPISFRKPYFLPCPLPLRGSEWCLLPWGEMKQQRKKSFRCQRRRSFQVKESHSWEVHERSNSIWADGRCVGSMHERSTNMWYPTSTTTSTRGS